MEAVLDTNVIASSAMNPSGVPGAIVAAWRRGEFTSVTSAELIAELERVLRSEKVARFIVLSEAEIVDLLAQVNERCVVVSPTLRLSVVKDEPDNRVLEAALAAGADYIVTGDRELLSLERYEGVEIIAPARFLSVLAETR